MRSPLLEDDFALRLVVEPAASAVGLDNELDVGAHRQEVDADAGGLDVADVVEVDHRHVGRIVQVLGGVAVGQDTPARVLRGDGRLADQPLDVARPLDDLA